MGGATFKERIEESSRTKGSNIILALDLTPEEPESLLSKSMRVLEETYRYICALKINRHLVLPLGLFGGVAKILEAAQDLGLPTIMDCKINDVGHTNRVIAEQYFKAGFDAVTANPLVGWEGGLKPVFEVARKAGRGVIILVYMSHKAASEGYGQRVYDPTAGVVKPQYVVFAERALSWGADGAVVGATYPEKIREVHAVLERRVPIYSPGVGVQGGSVESAVSSGARYLIVGRSIVLADDPCEAAKSLRERVLKILPGLNKRG